MNPFKLLAAFLAIAAFLSHPARAFNGHLNSFGPLKIEIAEIPEVTGFAKPVDVAVTLENTGDSPIEVDLEMTGLVDEWKAVGPAKQKVALKAKEKKKPGFRSRERARCIPRTIRCISTPGLIRTVNR